MRTVSAQLASRLPRKLVSALKRWRKRLRERQFLNQRMTRLKCGAYELSAPVNHPLPQLQLSQPGRDLCVGIAAQHVSRKYPAGSMVDIGANIGDTAAIIATYASNKLILVEGSDYFFSILGANVAQLPNKIELVNALVSDGSAASGSFSYWGGTASFIEESAGGQRIQTLQLGEVCDGNTCFVKVDTDGYDVKILMAGLAWLRSERPAVLFENEIRNENDLQLANQLLQRFSEIGYQHFLVWDDPGLHIVSTSSHQVLQDLNHYLLKVWQNPGRKSICNYDVLCLHEQDADIYASLSEWWRSH